MRQRPLLRKSRLERRFERSRSGDRPDISGEHRRTAMSNDTRDNDKPCRGFRFWRTPLFRLLVTVKNRRVG
jgi:hypothetical protein